MLHTSDGVPACLPAVLRGQLEPSVPLPAHASHPACLFASFPSLLCRYEETKKEADKWLPIIKANREAPTLRFTSDKSGGWVGG